MTLRTFAVLAAASTTATLALPSELFDSSIATKLRATYQAQPPVPSLWPQYTFPNGTWQYFGGNTWTTGFFPATMYAMAERAGLCPDLGLNASEWIEDGRGSSRWKRMCRGHVGERGDSCTMQGSIAQQRPGTKCRAVGAQITTVSAERRM